MYSKIEPTYDNICWRLSFDNRELIAENLTCFKEIETWKLENVNL